jgi:hypothetical protein
MADLTILELHDLGNDVLRVRGTDGSTRAVRVGTEDDGTTPVVEEQPVVYEATGWVSALTNHYDESAYDKDGHRKDTAKSRAMTDEERAEYAANLLREQNAELREPPRDLAGEGR